MNNTSDINTIYKQIENKILNHEIYQSVKDYSKAKEKINTYLSIGKLLNNIDSKYGNSIIKEYSKRLSMKFGKNIQHLYYIK